MILASAPDASSTIDANAECDTGDNCVNGGCPYYWPDENVGPCCLSPDERRASDRKPMWTTYYWPYYLLAVLVSGKSLSFGVVQRILSQSHHSIVSTGHPVCNDHIWWPSVFSTDSDFHMFCHIRCIYSNFFL